MNLRWMAALALLVGLVGRAEAQTHQLINLGTLPGSDYSQAEAVTNGGKVTGFTEKKSSTSSWPTVYHAFRVIPRDTNSDGVPDTWFVDANNDGVNDLMQDLGTLGGNWSLAHDLNESGYVVGESSTKSGYARAFLHDGSKMIDLTGKNSSIAYGISRDARVVGRIGERPFTWKGGRWNYLPGLTGATGQGRCYGINDHDLIVGVSPNAAGYNRAVVWEGGVIKELAMPVGTWLHSQAYDVSNDGLVAGVVWNEWGKDCQPVLWRNRVPEILPLAENTYEGLAIAVSAAGHALANLDTASDPNHTARKPYLWNGSTWSEANSLVDPNLGWSVTRLLSFSEDGKIAARGHQSIGIGRALILLPIVP